MSEAAKRARDIADKELDDAIRQAENQISTPNAHLLKQWITQIEELEALLRDCN